MHVPCELTGWGFKLQHSKHWSLGKTLPTDHQAQEDQHEETWWNYSDWRWHTDRSSSWATRTSSWTDASPPTTRYAANTASLATTSSDTKSTWTPTMEGGEAGKGEHKWNPCGCGGGGGGGSVGTRVFSIWGCCKFATSWWSHVTWLSVQYACSTCVLMRPANWLNETKLLSVYSTWQS